MRTVIRMILGAAVAFAAAGPAPCQAPTPGSEEGNRLMAYESFFFRVAFMEDQASRLRAQGKQTQLGSSIRSAYSLTAEQYSQLAAIAVDWKAKWTAINDKAGPLLAQGLRRSSSRSLNDLMEERVRMTMSHADQLQSALGGRMRLAALEALIMRPSASGPIFPR
jgi:hypothetical protein